LIDIGTSIKYTVGKMTAYKMEVIILYKENNLECQGLFNNVWWRGIRRFLDNDRH